MTFHFVNNSSMKMPKTYLHQSLNIFFKLLIKSLPQGLSSFQEISLVFLDPKLAKNLNKQYRNKNYPTDVLSFAGMEPSLGELVMCPQVLAAQAQEQKHSFRQETLYMAIHGTLHLLGYDHEKNKLKAKEMFALQEEMFTKTLRKLKN